MEFPSQLDIDFVRKLDSEDKLASFRNLFHFSDPDVCYLDGNSLGRLPKRTVRRR
jgi:kynureninase